MSLPWIIDSHAVFAKPREEPGAGRPIGLVPLHAPSTQVARVSYRREHTAGTTRHILPLPRHLSRGIDAGDDKPQLVYRGTPSDSAVRSNRVMPRERLVWVAIAVALISALGAMTWRTTAVPDAQEMRLEITTPESLASQFAISPDGRAIAYAGGGQPRRIWLHALDGTSPRPLSGTEGGEYPFWSPDGRSIGFFASNKLKRIDVEGGAPQLLANVLTPAGGTWNRDGTILYVPSDSGGVFAVAATGGETRQVKPTRRPGLATRLPQFLPNGRHFLFYVGRGGGPAGVYIGELGRDAIRRILTADWPALYGSGHLWFVRELTLFAQRFEPETQELSDPVIRIADNVGTGLIGASVSVSANGPSCIAPSPRVVRPNWKAVGHGWRGGGGNN